MLVMPSPSLVAGQCIPAVSLQQAGATRQQPPAQTVAHTYRRPLWVLNLGVVTMRHPVEPKALGECRGAKPLAGVWEYPPRFPLGVGGRGVQIALTRSQAFAIINPTGQKPAHEGGNVAQWQSGRFISARSQVRTLSLPHQPRRPIGRLHSRAVSSVVRALASHARGPRFDPSTAHQGPGVVGADEGIWPARATRAFGSLTEVPLECGCAEVAERQTRYVQGVVPLWVCGFKSHLRHQRARSGEIVSVRALVAQLDRAQPCGG